MDNYQPTRRPSQKMALSPAAAIVGVVLFLLFAMVVRGAFGVWPVVIAFLAMIPAYILMSPKSSYTARGKTLDIQEYRLVQRDGDVIVSKIDITQPFEYEILDRYDVMDSCFRLHQGESTLTFYNSDPGGMEVVRKVLQIEWPPPTRGPTYSHTPPTY